MVIFLLFFLYSILSQAAEKIVVLIPFNELDSSDEFFKGGSENFWYQLKAECAKAGYYLTTKRYYPKVYAIVTFNCPQKPVVVNDFSAKRILYTWEPPTIVSANFNPKIHRQYDIVATWQDNLIDHRKYRKFNYALQFNVPQEIVPFKEKKLCTMLVGCKTSTHPDELYSKRLRTIMHFEICGSADFDLYGPEWDPRIFYTYKGYAPNKIEVMKNYKFALVYENMCNIPGYITEKIFDAFSAGCIPVYWGASNVGDYIPENCFIDRTKFTSDAALYTFLKDMSKQEYNQYLQAIAQFLESEKAYYFSREYFVKTFIEILDSLQRI